VLLGLIRALAAIGLIRAIALVQASHDRVGMRTWLRPALAGLVTGAIALQLPEVLGRHETTGNALTNAYALQFVILLAIAKGGATAFCLGSSFGGMFSPKPGAGRGDRQRVRPDRGGRASRAWLGPERLRAARHGRARRLHAGRADLHRDRDLRADRRLRRHLLR
jgi:hypothetical protein